MSAKRNCHNCKYLCHGWGSFGSNDSDFTCHADAGYMLLLPAKGLDGIITKSILENKGNDCKEWGQK